MIYAFVSFTEVKAEQNQKLVCKSKRIYYTTIVTMHSTLNQQKSICDPFWENLPKCAETTIEIAKSRQ